ncbi:MAG: hypothetical protein K0S07_994 [Chlamydiales bacterium]|jgi:hypothetical protein|nr:hypothetical protein [Chlamydiales bacterium]
MSHYPRLGKNAKIGVSKLGTDLTAVGGAISPTGSLTTNKYVLISQATASNSTSLSFIFGTTYSSLMLVYTNVVASAVSQASLRMVISTNSSAPYSYITSNYSYQNMSTSLSDDSSSYIICGYGIAGGISCGRIYLDLQTALITYGQMSLYNGTNVIYDVISGDYSIGDPQALALYFSSGTIASGKFMLYGCL